MSTVVNTDRIQKFRWPTLIMQVIISAALTAPYILNIYLGPLNEKYGWSIGTLMITFTLSMWIGTPGTLLGGVLMEKFGNRKVIIGSGVIYGIAVVASGYVSNVFLFIILQGVVAAITMFTAYVCQLKNVGVLFPDKRGLAMGILMGGAWVGTAVMSPFAAWLIETMGTGGSLLVQGILYGGVTVVFGFLIVDAPEGAFVPKGWIPKVEETTDNTAAVAQGKLNIDLTWREMFKSPSLYFMWGFLMFIALACTMMSSNCSLIAQDAIGVDPMAASWVAFAYSLIQGLASVVMGFIVDKLGPYKVLITMAFFEGLLMLILVATGINSFALFIVTVGWIGATYGLVNMIFPLLSMNVFGEKHFGVNMTVVGCYNLMTNLVGPQCSARLSIEACFVLFGITSLIAIIFVLLFKRSLFSLAHKYRGQNMTE